MKYTNRQEWVKKNGNRATFGLTLGAVEQLGEIAYLELPKVGQLVKKEQMVCLIESAKTATEIYTPLSGKICRVNTKAFEQNISKIPSSGVWLFEIEMSDETEFDLLLSKEDL